MEIYLGLLVSFCLLIFSVLNKIYIGYMLIICWILFALISLKKGYSLREIIKMSYNGGRQSFVVLKILILLGAVISIWMASGTIPTIIYYSLKYITPNTFIITAFVICCLMSLLIGTSLGTVSTIGIPLMIIARSGNINLNIVAGAIIAGAFFGDRCSPMSSSAALVSNLTKTNIFLNIKHMFYSSIIPLMMSLVFYYALSISQPLRGFNGNLSNELSKTFNIGLIMLLPAVIIPILSIFKIKIHISILVSILSAFILCIIFQQYHLKQLVQYIIFGFEVNGTPLKTMLKGGGIVSMMKICIIIFVSCSFAGIFEGIKVFGKLKSLLIRMQLTRHKLFGITSAVSVIAAAFGCNQPITAIMTNEIMKDCYDKTDRHQFALDLENSAILIAPLIPWNTAALLPTTIMNTSATGFIPYAFYLYLLPVMYFIYTKFSNKDFKRKLNSVIRGF